MSLLALGWPFDGLGSMLGHAYVRHAFLAGTPIAAAAGLAGYFVVLRNQVFVSDAVSHFAFTGALAAYAAAIDPLVGLFGATSAAAVLLGLLGGRARANDVAIGTVFAWTLGLGVFFLSLYTTSHSASTGNIAVKVLFGSIFAISAREATVAILVSSGVVAALVAVVRPLLFASLDPDVAAARGVPVRGLGLLLVALVAITVAEAVQVVGSLLIIGLMVTPAASAARLTSRPYVALLLSPLIAVASVWAGLGISYGSRDIPPSFPIVALAFAVYVASVLATSRSRSRRAAAGA